MAHKKVDQAKFKIEQDIRQNNIEDYSFKAYRSCWRFYKSVLIKLQEFMKVFIKTKEDYKNHWKTMETYRRIRKLLKHYRNFWKTIEVFTRLWIFLESSKVYVTIYASK